MEIIGRSVETLEVVYRHRLGHGEDPRQAALGRGWKYCRPLRAELGSGDELTLTLLVSRRHGAAPRKRRRPARKPGAVVRQRPAAYAIALSDRGVLATQFSNITGVNGQWGLPGGGIEPGEAPDDTVLRESIEESGQDLQAPMLIDIQSDHWVGESPSGQLEDFHAVRLIYAAACPEPTDPVVNDVGGTTAAAQWVPLPQWQRVHWTRSARSLLQNHLDACVSGLELPRTA